MVGERGGDKESNIKKVEEGRKMKCDITVSLFSRRERDILGL
jgi:hypothetical protein